MRLRQVSFPKPSLKITPQTSPVELLTTICRTIVLPKIMQKELEFIQDSVQVHCTMSACRIRRICPSGERVRLLGDGGIPCMVCCSTQQAAQQASNQQIRPHRPRADLRHQQQACRSKQSPPQSAFKWKAQASLSTHIRHAPTQAYTGANVLHSLDK